jgi:hypothetical protein
MFKWLAPALWLMAAAGSACAEPGLFSPDTVSGLLDVRVAAADGERSWLDRGFGKTRVSGGGVHANVGEAALAWRPQLSWDWSAVAEAEVQPDHDGRIRLGEAYVAYKPMPVGGTRYSARVGLFYPPISQEHGGAFWTPTETITPSAVNSWVGEEVKVVGAEASARRTFVGQDLAVTGALFEFNDTSGTLLTARGWSLGDVRTSAYGHFDLPPRGGILRRAQAPITTPVAELDRRIGSYGRLDWRPPSRLSLNIFYYDNDGDLISKQKHQWAWRTRFWNLGARYDVSDTLTVRAQAMTGSTLMGYGDPDLWVKTEFSAGYLMVTQRLGDDGVSGRLDLFQTVNRADPAYGLTQERGWALTGDYRKYLSAHASLLFEALYVSSDRPARQVIVGEPPRQDQTVVQSALRLSF